MLVDMIARNWWTLVLRGVCAIVFGVVAWIWPGVTLGALVILWGCYTFADGVLAFAARILGYDGNTLVGPVAHRYRQHGRRGSGVRLPGPHRRRVALCDRLAGRSPPECWRSSPRSSSVGRSKANSGWDSPGALSIVYGAFLMARPGIGALAVMWMIGTYAVVFGVALVALGLRVRVSPLTVPDVTRVTALERRPAGSTTHPRSPARPVRANVEREVALRRRQPVGALRGIGRRIGLHVDRERAIRARTSRSLFLVPSE